MEISKEAWEAFLAIVKKAAPSHSLAAVYDDIAEIAKQRGWSWPSLPTIYRRWHSLDRAEQLTLRHGARRAAKDLYQPHRRDPSKLSSFQWVEMDGWALDLWARFEDGEIARPTILALVDRTSFKALHFVIGKAETALLTRDLILQTCDQFGIFDSLLTDNSRAFSSLLVAGGVKHKFRNANTRHPEWYNTFLNRRGKVREMDFHPLKDRITLNLRLAASDEAELNKAASQFCAHDPEAAAVLAKYGRSRGNIRSIATTYREASGLADGSPITATHINDAISMIGGI